MCDDPIDFGGVSVSQDALRSEVANQIAEQHLKQNYIERFVENTPMSVISDIRKDIDLRQHHELKYTKYSLIRWFNMLYFSISNTITMGYGDIYPMSIRAKILVVLQILCLFIVLCFQ